MLLIAASLLLMSSMATAADTIRVHSPMYQADTYKKLIIVIEPIEIINQDFMGPHQGIVLDRYYHFSQPVAEIETGIPYSAISPNGSEYTIYFSRIPLVIIDTPHQIHDEPRVYTHFTLVEPGGRITRSHAGAEIRGGLSQSFPKRSIRLEFWDDTEGNVTKDLSLLGMRNDDDWNLQAMYNEPLRLRSKSANQLWKLMHSPHYLEKNGVNGIRMEYVEFFLNGSYQGIYALGERVDRKQLQLEEYDGSLRGELYKGVDWGLTTFHSMPGFPGTELLWAGFEYDYPEEVIDWTKLYGLANFVINETDYYFYNNHHQVFETINMADYFIFLNLMRAPDNIGKNIYIARHDFDTPYFYVPWDLDGVLGTMYLGIREPITNDILTNGLYDRLIKDCQPSGFYQTLRTRWNKLREDLLTENKIMSLIQENHDMLLSNGAYARETLTWEDYTFNPDDMDYIKSWLSDRLAYLDVAFNMPCEGVELPEPPEEHIVVYPVPAKEKVNIQINGGLFPFDILIYNNTGQAVDAKTLHNKLTEVNLSHLPAGLYFVIVQNAYYREIKKIVISQ